MSDPKLSITDEDKVIQIIRTWKSKFNWDTLIAAIKEDMGIAITRQSLCTYDQIYDEYLIKKGRKQRTDDLGVEKIDKDVEELLEINEKLETRIAYLEEIRNKQLHLIENMMLNAKDTHIDLNDLVRPRS